MVSLPTGTPVPVHPSARLPKGAIAALGVGFVGIVWLALHVLVESRALRIGGGALALIAPALLACWYALGVTRRRELAPNDRTGWVFVGLSTGAAAIFALVVTLPADSQLGAVAVVGGVAHLLALLFASIGVLHWVRRRSPTASLGTLIDLACVAVLAYVVTWKTLLTSTILGIDRAQGIDQVTHYATPLLGTMLLLAVVTVLSQVGREDLRGTELLATFGIGGFVATDLGQALRGIDAGGLTATWHQTATGSSGSIAVLLGWMLGMTALGFSASLRRAAPEASSTVPLMARSTSWELLVALVPFVMLGLVIATTAASAHESSSMLSDRSLIALSALLLMRCTFVAINAIRVARSSQTDHLTGALSHRELQERLPCMVDTAITSGRCVSLLAIDLDDFGSFNETVSHAEGDRYLREVAWTIRARLGSNAQLFRIGGDDFAVLVDGVDSSGATKLAQEIAAAVGLISHEQMPDPSVTIGLASMPEHAADASELLHVATGTLWWSKMSGAPITCYDPGLVTMLSAEERVAATEHSVSLRAVLALARALDARDAYTARHSENVSRYSTAIAEELGWAGERLELLRVAGLLHDVGKIGVRDSTLRKSSQLTEGEWQEMQTHPALGASMIAGVAPEELITWVLSHHERMDGTGYPMMMSGDDIPDGAKVLAVADTFDAMTSSRSYRRALSPLRAIDEIVNGAGTQFDPDAVRAFLRALRSGAINVQQVAEHAQRAPAQEQWMPDAAEVVLGEFVALDPEFAGAAAVELYVPDGEEFLISAG
ncbi:MAG: diguanylate cyclase, partial [Thermoleophilia bacterium]|nr:diguanylate cyclase [Thermoleophilia bacterium]